MNKGIVKSAIFVFLILAIYNICSVPVSGKTATDLENTASDSYMIDLYPYVADYDYEFYLEGIYLSADGKNDQLYIHPIDLVFGTETEKLAEYGIQDEGVTYYEYEYTDELLSLPLKPETQFHIINWNRNPEMAEQSLNHPDPTLGCICALDDPFAFFEFMSDDYGTHLAVYPLCLYLDEDGYVETLIELCLP